MATPCWKSGLNCRRAVGRGKILLTLVALLLIPSYHRVDVVASEPFTVSSDQQQQQHQPTCSLYLAPSTIPNAGYGVFTTIPLFPGDIVGEGDLLVPLQDVLNHPRSGLSKFHTNPLEDYTWDLRTVLWNIGHREHASTIPSKVASAFCPGLESLLNSNLVLLNVQQLERKAISKQQYHQSQQYQNQQQSYVPHGAASPFHKLSTVVTHTIPKGGELFTHYGDDWFLQRTAPIYRTVPLSTDMPLAEALVQKMQNMSILVRHDPVIMHRQMDHMMRWSTEPQRQRLLRVLPHSVDQLHVAFSSGQLRPVHQPSGIRAVEELKATGACLDRIAVQPSRIPRAGRGAFAKTRITAGERITTSPVLPISNYHQALAWQVWNPDTKQYESKATPHNPGKHYPLLLNYCWGHVNTTLLLCPYGMGVSYINHAPHPSQINVRIEWSNRTGFPPVPRDKLETNPLDWPPSQQQRQRQQYHTDDDDDDDDDEPITSTISHLAFFDYVATRDIDEGEELLVDYGSKWYEAWTKFEQNPPLRNLPVLSDAELQELNQRQEVLRTEEEQDTDPYPYMIVMRCHEEIFQTLLEHTVKPEDLWGSSSGSSNSATGGAGTSSSSSSSSSSAGSSHHHHRRSHVHHGTPCTILERNFDVYTQQITYAVRAIRPGPVHHPVTWVGRAGIPRAYITLVYSNDLETYHFIEPAMAPATSFRFPMQLPNDMLPKAWNNVVLEQQPNMTKTTTTSSREEEESEEEIQNFGQQLQHNFELPPQQQQQQ